MEHLVFWTSSGKFCVRSGEGGCIVSNAHKPLGPFGDNAARTHPPDRNELPPFKVQANHAGHDEGKADQTCQVERLAEPQNAH